MRDEEALLHGAPAGDPRQSITGCIAKRVATALTGNDGQPKSAPGPEDAWKVKAAFFAE
jgi:hypothetical protein